jgi:hypothetical protein
LGSRQEETQHQKKTPRLVYNTKYLQIYQIWRLKQPINQSNKVPAPSLAKQIKYGLPYLIDLFDAECASGKKLRPAVIFKGKNLQST